MFFELCLLFVLIGLGLALIGMVGKGQEILCVVAIIFLLVGLGCMFISFTTFSHETKIIVVSDKLDNNVVIAHNVSGDCNDDVSYIVTKAVDYSHLKINGTYSVVIARQDDAKVFFKEMANVGYIGSINTPCDNKQTCVV